MNVDEKLLSKLENLSALQIDSIKRDETIKEISKIVDFVENLNELDLKDKKESFSSINGGTNLRDDVPFSDTECIKDILEHSPKSEKGFFVVPKIIE
jgi:aspartyl-tRNA(Asn)/glutamyl-tRNA(Gln) amidotransferase subunit C